MRFFYADPGLHQNIGHHPNMCESVLREVAARGIPTRVLAFVDVDASFKQKFSAVPLFRYNLYWRTDHDPLCGPAYAFHAGAKAIREDLDRLNDITPDDVVFMPWATPALLWGAVQWMSDLPASRMPRMIVNFLDVPDVTLQRQNGEVRLILPDYRVEPSAMFLRLAAKHVTPVLRPRLRLGCFHPEGVSVLGAVLCLPVEKLPAPQQAITSCRHRDVISPALIGMVGHQRGYAKGVQYMPEIVQAVLQGHPDVKIVIHDGSRDLLPEVTAALHQIASRDSRFTLNQSPLDSAGWAALLDRLDLVVCPYSRSEYRLMSSGVHNEAIANAIPCVVPSDTTLSAAAKEYGDCSVAFGPGEPTSIVSAIRETLAAFDRYAQAAKRGAEKWAGVNGPAHLLDTLIGTPAKGGSPKS